MINDANTLTEIRAGWHGLEVLRGKIQRSLFASLGAMGGIYPFKAADAAHNLPFMHALAVFNDTLEAMKNEGRFKCGTRNLGHLLKAAKHELDWVDYKLIKEAVSKRNGVAHHGELVPRGDCWKFIDAVKSELIAWGIVKAT